MLLKYSQSICTSSLSACISDVNTLVNNRMHDVFTHVWVHGYIGVHSPLLSTVYVGAGSLAKPIAPGVWIDRLPYHHYL